MNITMEDDYRIVTVEDKKQSEHISRAVSLVRGALMALSYNQSLVDEYIPDSDEV